mgnify:CR=1 FL=1
MQAKTSTVIVRSADGTPKTLTDVNVLMGNLGLFIKGEDSLEMYVWESVLYMQWKDLAAQKSVWEEALAELVAEAFDDDEWDDEEDEAAEVATPTLSPPVTTASPDDPTVNPYR